MLYIGPLMGLISTNWALQCIKVCKLGSPSLALLSVLSGPQSVWDKELLERCWCIVQLVGRRELSPFLATQQYFPILAPQCNIYLWKEERTRRGLTDCCLSSYCGRGESEADLLQAAACWISWKLREKEAATASKSNHSFCVDVAISIDSHNSSHGCWICSSVTSSLLLNRTIVTPFSWQVST